VHGIDTDIAGQSLRGGCFANANGHGRRASASPEAALL
jgi:hypothetical protein